MKAKNYKVVLVTAVGEKYEDETEINDEPLTREDAMSVAKLERFSASVGDTIEVINIKTNKVIYTLFGKQEWGG